MLADTDTARAPMMLRATDKPSATAVDDDPPIETAAATERK